MRAIREAAVLVTALAVVGGAGFAAAGNPDAKNEGTRDGAVRTERQAGKSADHGGKSAVIPAGRSTWQDGPASLPVGAEFAVLEGDPAQTGPFTMRLRLPEGYEIPPHTHPAIEHVTVLSGTLNVAMGEKIDKSRGQPLSSGGFMVMQPGMPHYVWATGETVIQLHGIGPWGIDYVNPSDDPRQRVRGEDAPTR